MYIKIKVFSKEKAEGIEKKSQDSFIVKVKEKPEEGKANKRVREIIAGFFNVNIGKVRLIKGSRQPNKIFEIINEKP